MTASTLPIGVHRNSSLPAAAAMSGLGLGACLLAGWAPLGFSIATVFLFAGPHNWMEARYFLSRMPAKWGRLRTFYLSGILGVLTLAAASVALPSVARSSQWANEQWLWGLAVWNTALVAWVVWMAHLRRAERPDRRPWPLLAPCSLALVAANWLWPMAWSLTLVYLHPLIAMWFLDRELARRKSPWHGAYRRCLALVPLLLAALWWHLADAPELPGQDLLSLQITNHAGANILSGISSHLLVSTHTFLEMLHYAVWLVAIPLMASGRGAPWRWPTSPLMRKSRRWRLAILAVLAAGLLAVLLFWAGFLANYPLTRDIYFTLAIVHVLAEAPFLLRLL